MTCSAPPTAQYLTAWRRTNAAMAVEDICRMSWAAMYTRQLLSPDWDSDPEVNGYVHALVTAVTPASATIKIWRSTSMLSPADAVWTRRKLSDILRPGDIAYVKIVSLRTTKRGSAWKKTPARKARSSQSTTQRARSKPWSAGAISTLEIQSFNSGAAPGRIVL